MQYISKATENNWRRLNSDTSSRLTSRANKTASSRKVVASSYLKSREAIRYLHEIYEIDAPVKDIMYSLCVRSLQLAGIADKPHVIEFLNSLSGNIIPGIHVSDGLFADNNDILGFIYQSLVSEAVRILSGIYYTNAEIVRYIASHLKIAEGETVLDPCCGSGTFLLHCGVDNPEFLYGFDIDPIAVMLASTNLLIRFRDRVFTPNIFCLDFLDRNAPQGVHCGPDKFDFILTNPPWGADKAGAYDGLYPQIKSRERASMTIISALSHLADGGKACMVLPLSILNTAVHSDIRRHILTQSRIDRIDIFAERFDGVFTNFFSLQILKDEAGSRQQYIVTGNGNPATITLGENDIDQCELKLTAASDIQQSVISKMETMGCQTLADSRFALGIVTGDNKRLLLDTPEEGAEPIYTGKDVACTRMLPANKYIRFNRNAFQQCAPEQCYRAPEKLVYRFIARYPIVSYDTTGALTLNSANIIIPTLRGISTKGVCALLNSSLYRYYYVTKFRDIKVLKKNLCALPFPELSAVQDKKLSRMLESNLRFEQIDAEVFSIFNITSTERQFILKELSNT